MFIVIEDVEIMKINMIGKRISKKLPEAIIPGVVRILTTAETVPMMEITFITTRRFVMERVLSFLE